MSMKQTTINHQQGHMTLMTARRLLGQRSRSGQPAIAIEIVWRR